MTYSFAKSTQGKTGLNGKMKTPTTLISLDLLRGGGKEESTAKRIRILKYLESCKKDKIIRKEGSDWTCILLHVYFSLHKNGKTKKGHMGCFGGRRIIEG